MSAAVKSGYTRLAEEKRRDESASLLDSELEEIKKEEQPEKRERQYYYQVSPVRRVMPQDVQEIAPWLLPRLSQIWPTTSDAMWASKIRAWMMMNDASFIRTENTVGLSMAVRNDMDNTIRVEERFVLGRELSTRTEDRTLHPIDAELLSIYRVMRDWARAKGARTFDVLIKSDLMDHIFIKYLGWNLDKRSRHWLKLGK